MIDQLQNQESQDLRNDLDQVQNYTQKLAADTSVMIIELIKMQLWNEAKKKTRLSDEYMTALNALQAMQMSAAQKTNNDVKRIKEQDLKLKDPFAKSIDDPEQLLQLEQATKQTETQQRDFEEQERDVQKLESDIFEVNKIFKELGSVMNNQADEAEKIDSIESIIEDAENMIDEIEEVDDEVEYNISDRMFYSITVSSATIVLTVIFSIYKIMGIV